MKFIYNENLTKGVVEDYYRTYEDIDGKLEIKTGERKMPLAGRFVAWHNVPTISFILKGTMEVDGEMQPVEIAISESDVENAFTTMIESSGRTVKKISMNFNGNGFKNILVEATSKRKIKE